MILDVLLADTLSAKTDKGLMLNSIRPFSSAVGDGRLAPLSYRRLLRGAQSQGSVFTLIHHGVPYGDPPRPQGASAAHRAG